MRTRTTLAAALLVAAGALLGWLPGAGRLRPNVPAGPGAVAASVQPAKEPDRDDQSAAKEGKKPNVVFILMDNLGYGEVGCYGGGILRGAGNNEPEA
jgi:arylsulfatase